MLIPKNDFVIIDLVDNTKKNSALDLDLFKKGFTNMDRITFPNQGRLGCGHEIFFFHDGAVKLPDGKYLIHGSTIFILNGQLTVPGLIVNKMKFTNNQSGLDLGTEKYFQVFQSNVPEVPIDHAIVIVPHAAYKFNWLGNEHFYISPESVRVNIGSGEIKAGPEYKMLRQIKENDIWGVDVKKGCGLDTEDGITKYFRRDVSEITINNFDYYIVEKDDIFACSKNK